MASVYNSTSNSGAFTGGWEDIQAYTSVIITVNAGTPGTIFVDWVGTRDIDSFPTAQTLPLVSDSFAVLGGVTVTKQFDTRARFFRVRTTVNPINKLATTFKKAPTEIKLTDDSTSIVNVNLGDNARNSLYTAPTDICGTILRSTGTPAGAALYTHLADASGFSLMTTDNYRSINRVDFSLYKFTSTQDVVLNPSGGLNVLGDTIIFDERTFRVHKSRMCAKDGDIVQMITRRSGDTGALDINGVFAGSTPVNGHLKVTGKVQYVAVEPNHVRFRVLTAENMSNWFNPAVGFTLLPAKSPANMVIGQKQWTVCGTTGPFYFKDISLTNGPERGLKATVDNFYDIFADPSGFGAATTGVSISGSNMIYPVDMRFWRGSLEDWTNGGGDGLSSIRTTVMKVLGQNNPAESLSVALRDAQNLSLASTGAGTTGYFFNSLQAPRTRNILFLVDSTSSYPNADTQDKIDINQIIGSLVGRTLTEVKGDIDPTGIINSANPRITARLITYHNQSDANDKMFFTSVGDDPLSTTLGSGIVNQVQPAITAITTLGANIDYWGALAKYVNGGYAAGPDPNLDAIVLQVSTSGAQIVNSDFSQNLFDICGYFGRVRRIAVTPAVTPDMLAFATTPDDVYTYSYATLGLDMSNIAHQIAGKLTRIAHVGHNALSVHTADVCGHSQAGTRPVRGAQFGTSALYYALSDSCGSQITTTKTSTGLNSNNALYVSLTDYNGGSITETNPLYVTLDGDVTDGHSFDLTVSGVLTTFRDISTANTSDSSGFNLSSLGFANETPAPIWVKVYDISAQGALSIGTNPTGLRPYLKYNFAVPGLNYRDLQFSKPVLFNNGIHFVASTNYKYDVFEYPPGDKHIFVNGNYSRVTL